MALLCPLLRFQQQQRQQWQRHLQCEKLLLAAQSAVRRPVRSLHRLPLLLVMLAALMLARQVTALPPLLWRAHLARP